jgi:hypothetical protein
MLMDNARSLNNAFAMGSFCSLKYKHKTNGPPSERIFGQTYRAINTYAKCGDLAIVKTRNIFSQILADARNEANAEFGQLFMIETQAAMDKRLSRLSEVSSTRYTFIETRLLPYRCPKTLSKSWKNICVNITHSSKGF